MSPPENYMWPCTLPLHIIAETTAIPQFGVDHHFVSSHCDGSKYVFLYVDPSIYGTNGSQVGLHAIVANATLLTSPWDLPFEGKIANLTYEAKDVLAPYLAPTPIEGFSVHHYTQLLFAQPDDWTFPAEYDDILSRNPSNLSNRLALDLAKFVNVAGLGQPVAATYFNMNKAPNTTTA